MKTAKRPPNSTKSQNRLNLLQALRVMHTKGQALLAGKRIAASALNTWSTSCAEYVAKLFGECSEHVESFKDPFVGCWTGQEVDLRQEERERRMKLKDRLAILAQLIDQLEAEIAVESVSASMPVSPDEAAWALVHAKVVKCSKQRFDGGHYADAVEAGFKELNSEVKEIVRKKTGKEFDGADLMRQAFSPNGPIIVLDDLSSETGRSIQRGYMDLFAGAMTGIRNPKAHGNLNITKDRALHHLFLASLLFHKLDERP
jgi:uncharacterized protein (TIGR02391 family)